jgi:PilZ domain
MAAAPLPITVPPVWMTVGTPVTLLPVDLSSGLLTGEVSHWLGGAAGLVATIGVQTSSSVAAMCAGQRLWLSGYEAERAELVVFEVVAQLPSRYSDTALTLTGVLPIAHERRRRAVRAASRHPVRVTFEDGAKADGVAVDLSHTGCRISLNHSDFIGPVGSSADLELELPGGERFALTGDIVRVEGLTGELALHFRPTEIELAPIDRLVYATVKRDTLER